VYGQKIPHQGPTLAGHETKGNQIILQMKNIDGGMKARGDALKGFAIAGADKKWAFANARIEGDKILLSHESIKAPLFVRYAWADNTVGNLFNGAGLPAGPFRTDKD
jgi:sialate O-acetylesterase